MVLPISIVEFIINVVGKSTTITIDPCLNFNDDGGVECITITGSPITLQDVLIAFNKLDSSIEEYFDGWGVGYTFESMLFDKSKNKYFMYWND